MTVEQERELIQKVLGGDQSTFKTLVQQYERLVLHIVTPLIGVSEDREDICQDIFIKVYKGLRSFKQNSRLSTWIGNIAYNTSLNFLRKKKPVLLEDLKPVSSENEGSLTTNSPYNEIVSMKKATTPEIDLINKEIKFTISEAIDKLPEMQRLTIILFHLEELSLREIGNIMSLPENTVKSHLFRGRNKLKELINL